MQHFYSKLILSGWKILRSGNYVKPILTYPQSFVNNQHINFIHQYTVPEDVKGGVCVDIGANCGSFTEVYKEYFSKIYFIEPQKSLYENVANKFKDYDHIVGFNYAVWNKDDEELTLVNHSNKDSGSVGVKGGSINQDWTDEIVNFVTSISLESLYEKIEGVIDYMKIDCENSEYEFLYGKDLSRIKYIGMELHNQMGSDKFYSLCEYIKKTHSLINGKEEFFDNAHQILLYKLK